MDQLTIGARGGRLEDDPPTRLNHVDLIGARYVNMSTCLPVSTTPLDGRRFPGHRAVLWP